MSERLTAADLESIRRELRGDRVPADREWDNLACWASGYGDRLLDEIAALRAELVAHEIRDLDLSLDNPPMGCSHFATADPLTGLQQAR